MAYSRILILDGYVDEPSTLGVPPYISPYVRYIYGAVRQGLEESGKKGEIRYLTIGQYRELNRKGNNSAPLTDTDLLIILNNTPVPGNYLSGRPASPRELNEIGEAAERAGIEVISWKSRVMGAMNLQRDADAFVYDLLTGAGERDRYRTMEEWDEWAVAGAEIIRMHPDFPERLIAEVDTLKGCVRYINGGCSFCTEPLERFRMRSVDSILREVEALVKNGLKALRLGGSCIFSFQARGIGETDRPTPDPEKITPLLSGIRRLLPADGVFHVDNANSGIIASHLEEAESIIRALVRFTTPGGSLSLGLESADPMVVERNHLNAKPEEVREAVRLINRHGRERGENGMPHLLPGINLLYGLPGETEETFRLNFEFLKGLRDEGMLFRRINIRQLSPVRIQGQGRKPVFRKWKERVRQEIDLPNLRDILPVGTVLRRVHIEKHDGGVSFGRQTGTYPILVGIPFSVEIGKTVDVKITDYGLRSVTGIPVPFDINHASLKALSSLPGIGKKRAARLIRCRPFHSFEELERCMEDREVVEGLKGFVWFE